MTRVLPIVPVIIAAMIMPMTAAATKTDVVLVINGNAVIGVIEPLEFGDAPDSTDSMGTVHIDW